MMLGTAESSKKMEKKKSNIPDGENHDGEKNLPGRMGVAGKTELTLAYWLGRQ